MAKGTAPFKQFNSKRREQPLASNADREKGDSPADSLQDQTQGKAVLLRVKEDKEGESPLQQRRRKHGDSPSQAMLTGDSPLPAAGLVWEHKRGQPQVISSLPYGREPKNRRKGTAPCQAT